MQRKFLEDLGIEKDAIDKIMTENGNDINKTKEKLESERDNYKSQLETAQETLKGFDGIDILAIGLGSRLTVADCHQAAPEAASHQKCQ